MNTAADPGHEALDVVARVLEAAKSEFEGTSTWLALADTAGTVVNDWATGDSMRRSLQLSEIERGFGFDVNKAGRNGIGVALSTPAIAYVSGDEHEDARFQTLSCAAAAIRHPLTKQLVGVLNLSALAFDSTPWLKVALRHTVKDVSRALYGTSQARQRRLFESHLRLKSATSAVVVTLDDTMFLVDGDAPHSRFDRAALWEMVQNAPPTVNAVRLDDGSRAQIVPLDSTDRSVGVSLVVDAADTTCLFAQANVAADSSHLSPLEAAERKLILETLRLSDGNKKETARRLQISRGTLYDRIHRYGLTAA